MFAYLRYFALLSLVLVVIGAVALSMYFKEIKQNELLGAATVHSKATLQSYADTVWQRFRLNPSGSAGHPVRPRSETGDEFQGCALGFVLTPLRAIAASMQLQSALG